MTIIQNDSISEQNQGGIKHNYPLAIEDASFKTAFSLLLKTMPYTLLRFAVLILVSIVTVIWIGITLGGYAGLASMKFDTLAMLWGLFSVGSYGGLWGLVIRYSLYMVKCGHIAVITELITKGSISNGNENMFLYGKRIVSERFKDVNVLFVIDQTVNSVIKSFNRTLDWISSLIPIPGLDKLMQLVQSVLYFAATFIDETIFSYTLARNETNPWQGAQDGLIYYCQNSKEILKTAVWAVIIDKIATVLIWILFMLPGIALTFIFPSQNWLTLPIILGGILLGSNFRDAFLKPLFLIMIMVKFHVSVKAQPINAVWDERLTAVSSKFAEIKDNAIAWVKSSTGELKDKIA